MKQTILHGGLDVDNTRFYGWDFEQYTGAGLYSQYRRTLKGRIPQRRKLSQRFPGCVPRWCGEASYLGYTRHRGLAHKGYHRDVVAPTSIPNPRCKPIKTDRFDEEP